MTKCRMIITMCLSLFIIDSSLLAEQVPGVVIYHSPPASKIYIGSPGIAVLANGDYLAKCDEFGPRSTENTCAVTHVFRSRDRGRSWKHISRVTCLFWSSIFLYQGDPYMLGIDRQYGNIVVMRSDDGGHTWTKPRDENTGLLTRNGQYHCAPVPVLFHNGRLWRAVERLGAHNKWGSFGAGVISAPIGCDLLQAKNWTFTNFLQVPPKFPGRHWLEGNVVVTPDGKLVNILRTGFLPNGGKAALLNITPDGKTISIDVPHSLIDFPGASKKFTIRFDPKSKLYWTLSNPVLPRHRGPNPGSIRNTVALMASPNLRNWTTRAIILYHPDVKKHGFQYLDWLFEGDDIIAVSRTAYVLKNDIPPKQHDANYLTFHRIKNFRQLSQKTLPVKKNR